MSDAATVRPTDSASASSAHKAPARTASAAREGTTPPRLGSVGARMVNTMRMVLAFSALGVMYVAPSEPARMIALTYVSLIAYCAYAVVVYFCETRDPALAAARLNHWADVCFYVCLIALTGGTSSIYFLFFFFPILVASFSGGLREGLLVTAVSFALFTLVGVHVAQSGPNFELGPALIGPLSILILGYMIAYWGGCEVTLKRRLTLLKEVNNRWNPRFGVDHTIGINLDRVLEHHGANSCALVLQRPAASVLLYSASPDKPGRLAHPSEIPETTVHALLGLSPTLALAYRDASISRLRGGVRLIGYDFATGSRSTAALHACRSIATLLDTSAFITVPYSQADGTVGRIFVTCAGKSFTQSDIEFLFQVAATISRVLENMQLMDELVSRAAEHERYKISRDIHDTTIQPYIGLKLGLEALYRESGEQDRPDRILELIEMANMTIRDLRAYAANLRDKAPLPGDFLVSAVNKQVERYRRFYGIDVEVRSRINDRLDSRLAAESFQIVAEGLSNVLRHTAAKRAFVHILCEEANLLLKIGNEARAAPEPVSDFVAWSIKERAEELGGSSFTERGVDGYTVVHVSIPI